MSGTTKEALALRWTDVFYDEDGVMRVNISEDVAKTGIARQPAVLDGRVQTRLEERRARARSDEEFVIGAPSDPLKQWGKTGNGGASQILAELYMKVAKKARTIRSGPAPSWDPIWTLSGHQLDSRS